VLPFNSKGNTPVYRIVDDANRTPLNDRLVPSHSKTGTLDLTASHLFWGDLDLQADLIAVVEKHAGHVSFPFSQRELKAAPLLFTFIKPHTSSWWQIIIIWNTAMVLTWPMLFSASC
jgi:hypothetical protein